MAEPRPGILFSQMQPDTGDEGAFNEWYDRYHVPSRLALDDFVGAARYRALGEERQYLAVYSMGDLGVLESEPYRRLKSDPPAETTEMLRRVSGFTRYIGERISDEGEGGSQPFLSVVAFAVPEADEEEFEDWYASEHAPALLWIDGWERIHRYRVGEREGTPWTHLALHELRSPELMESPGRAAARRGPKRDALAGREWFGHSGRWLYERIGAWDNS